MSGPIPHLEAVIDGEAPIPSLTEAQKARINKVAGELAAADAFGYANVQLPEFAHKGAQASPELVEHR